MTLPGITQTVRDRGLGLQALGSEYHCKIGLCTLGTENSVYAFGDPQTVRDTLGRGPLVEALCLSLERAGKPVLAVRATQTTAGSVGTITQSGAGPLITATGAAPNDAYELKVEILVGGAVGTSQFRYSLDGGDTWSGAIATAASYVIPDSGITIQFPAGTYVLGEVYSATCTPPAYDTTALNTALDAAIAAVQQWRLVHIVGYGSSAAGSATIAAAVASKMASAATAFRYAYAVIEAADDSDANLLSAFASAADVRVMVAAGFCELVSAVDARLYKRPAAWPIVDRLMSSVVSRDPGAVIDGPLVGVTALHRDERLTPGLHDARFATLRTFRGVPGFFVTGGRMMAPVGSDFADAPNRQVMDVASRASYEALLPYLNVDLLIDAAGLLDEREAVGIEKVVLNRLRDAVTRPGDASDVDFVLNRATNLLSTQKLVGKTRVRPKGYARFIENEIAFTNPAI